MKPINGGLGMINLTDRKLKALVKNLGLDWGNFKRMSSYSKKGKRYECDLVIGEDLIKVRQPYLYFNNQLVLLTFQP